MVFGIQIQKKPPDHSEGLRKNHFKTNIPSALCVRHAHMHHTKEGDIFGCFDHGLMLGINKVVFNGE